MAATCSSCVRFDKTGCLHILGCGIVELLKINDAADFYFSKHALFLLPCAQCQQTN